MFTTIRDDVSEAGSTDPCNDAQNFMNRTLYKDPSPVPGLGQITWRIVLTEKNQGALAQKSRNSRRVSGGGVGA